MDVCLAGELAGTNILGRLATGHRRPEVQHAPRDKRVDRACTEPSPRLLATAVRTIGHVRTRGIRDNERPPGDRPQLFGEEWIVRDVGLGLLRQAVGIVELVGTGEPDDLRQGLVPGPPGLRVSLDPPGNTAGSNADGENRGDNPPAPLHTGMRDSG